MVKRTGLIAIGLSFFGMGAFLYLAGGPAGADIALAIRCETEMSRRVANVARCGDTAFATAITAIDADTAARAIGGADSPDVTGNTLAMGMSGVVLASSGPVVRR